MSAKENNRDFMKPEAGMCNNGGVMRVIIICRKKTESLCTILRKLWYAGVIYSEWVTAGNTDINKCSKSIASVV